MVLMIRGIGCIAKLGRLSDAQTGDVLGGDRSGFAAVDHERVSIRSEALANNCPTSVFDIPIEGNQSGPNGRRLAYRGWRSKEAVRAPPIRLLASPLNV